MPRDHETRELVAFDTLRQTAEVAIRGTALAAGPEEGYSVNRAESLGAPEGGRTMKIETTIYPAGPPRRGEWVLRWRTAAMPWPKFDYFPTREAAEARGKEMREEASTQKGEEQTNYPART